MPKRRSPDKNHFTYRLELQQTERDALELLAASMAAKNISSSFANVVTPFTTATAAGVAWAVAILGGAWAMSNEEKAMEILGEATEGTIFNVLAGPFWGGINMVSNNEVKHRFENMMAAIRDN